RWLIGDYGVEICSVCRDPVGKLLNRQAARNNTMGSCQFESKLVAARLACQRSKLILRYGHLNATRIGKFLQICTERLIGELFQEQNRWRGAIEQQQLLDLFAPGFEPTRHLERDQPAHGPATELVWTAWPCTAQFVEIADRHLFYRGEW